MNIFSSEIHGFDSPEKFDEFVQIIEKELTMKNIRELSPNRLTEYGWIEGLRWFSDKYHRELWRLVPPDPPFYGVWEKVRDSEI